MSIIVKLQFYRYQMRDTMKKGLALLLGGLCHVLLAQPITVNVEEFIVRHGDYVTIEVKADNAVDESKNTTVCLSDKRECYLSGAKIEIKAEVNEKGLTTVGPYQLQFGKDKVQVPPQKIIALPVLKDGDIDITGAVDPNGSGKFMLRIDWQGKGLVEYRKPIRLRESILVYPCDNKKGLMLHEGSGSSSQNEGSYITVFENTSDKAVMLTNEDFINLPNNYKTLSIEVPPSKQKRDCKHERFM